jgi:4-hydroxy-tetrahydrodipicolinate synthase
MENSFLRGTGVALVTPFNSDKTIDYTALTKLVKYLIDGGVDYLVVMGTTGESVVLSDSEKQSVLNHVKDVNQGALPIVLGIGGNNTSNVVEHIEKQNFTGVSALLSVCPYYNKPNQSGLFAHFSEIATACPVPIILYNVPGRTGSWMSPETTIRLAEKFDNVVATKEASGQIENIMKIIKDKPANFKVISGDDGLTLPLIAMGVEGVISVVGNAAPFMMSQMVNSALANEYMKARELHYMLFPLIELIFKEGNPAGVKAALNSIGLLQNEVRLPLTSVSNELFDTIAQQMKQLK